MRALHLALEDQISNQMGPDVWRHCKDLLDPGMSIGRRADSVEVRTEITNRVFERTGQEVEA